MTVVPHSYQLADLFVMPSVSEPFGIVALEAMQNGTPVLVSKQSGVSEVSNHVYKVDFWNMEDMRDSVLHCLHDPHASHAMRRGAKQELEQLTWDHAAAKMRHVYEQVLANFSPAPALALETVVA